MARHPLPRNNRPFAVRDFPPGTGPDAQRPLASHGMISSSPPQRPSASHGMNYPPATAARRPSASRSFPPLCGNEYDQSLDVASTRRPLHGTVARDWLQFLLLEQADDRDTVGPTPLPATDNDADDLMWSDVDADVEDLVSAWESDDVGGDDDIFPYADDLLFMGEIDEDLNSDGLPEEVVMQLMKKMSCEEVDGDSGVCAVCQDDLCGEDRRDVGVIDCRHRFHADCIGKWLRMKNVCPLCKAVALHFS